MERYITVGILDEDGPYYWHIKSGTIQRDPPPPAPPSRSKDITSLPENTAQV